MPVASVLKTLRSAKLNHAVLTHKVRIDGTLSCTHESAAQLIVENRFRFASEAHMKII